MIEVTETEKKRSRFFNQKDKEFARSMNILSYLQACGEQFEEVSSGTYQHADHDSLRYNIQKNVLNHFSDTNSKAAFNCIDAAILMYGFTYSEAVHDIFKKSKLIPEGGIQQTFYSKPKNFDYNRDVKEVAFPQRAYRYLTEERGLNKKLIDFCIKDGTIAGDTLGNVVFKWKDMKDYKSNKLVGASIRGTRIIPEEKRKDPKTKYFRKILAGSQSNAGYYFDLGIPEKLVIGEAAIDVLSYVSRKINNGEKETLKNTRFASMEGLKDKTFLNQFTAVNHIQQKTGRNKTPKVLFVVDNDQPGQDFIFKMEELGESYNFGDYKLGDCFSYEMVPSIEMENGKLMKDQNDLLLYMSRQNKELVQEVNVNQQQPHQQLGGR